MLIEEKYHTCVEGLASFARGIGMTDAVIGLSGGIDRAGRLHVRRCLRRRACPRLYASGPYSSEHSLVDAQELALNWEFAQSASQSESLSRRSSTPSGTLHHGAGPCCREYAGAMPHDRAHGASNAHGWMVNTRQK
ncbi:MAG: hypothetical protein ACLT98_04440 [Eggerthellaceae bacterium]